MDMIPYESMYLFGVSHCDSILHTKFNKV